jgi:hypothetical protein
MGNKLFRQQAMDTLESPDKISDYIRVTGPSFYLWLVSILVCVIAVCIWAFNSTINEFVKINGIAFPHQEIMHVHTPLDGRIVEVFIHKGDEVVVVRGRKVAKGSIGKVFWIGDCYNQFSYRTETRVGMIIGEEKVFLPIEYVIKNEWEKFLLTGKARKQAIRNATINSLPYRYRKLFV